VPCFSAVLALRADPLRGLEVSRSHRLGLPHAADVSDVKSVSAVIHFGTELVAPIDMIVLSPRAARVRAVTIDTTAVARPYRWNANKGECDHTLVRAFPCCRMFYVQRAAGPRGDAR
jgi:hypothetical protein